MTEKVNAVAITNKTTYSYVRQLIKRDFCVDLPISGGTGNSVRNAVVIHYMQPNIYVSVEYAYLKYIGIGKGISWIRISQELFDLDNRTYDKLKIKTVLETDTEVITQIENFYFDITECFGR